jgi:hypothetical protein
MIVNINKSDIDNDSHTVVGVIISYSRLDPIGLLITYHADQ